MEIGSPTREEVIMKITDPLAEQPEHDLARIGDVVMQSDKYTARVSKFVDADSVVERFWELEHGSFLELNDSSIGRQNATKEEFLADLKNPGVLKFSIEPTGSGIESSFGLLFLYTDVDQVSWVDRRFYRDQAPDIDPTKPVVYISTLCIDPELGTLGAGRFLVHAVGEYSFQHFAFGNEQIQAFTDHTAANLALPRYLDICMKAPIPEAVDVPVKMVEVGRHDFLVLTPPAEQLEQQCRVETVVDETIGDQIQALQYQLDAARDIHGPMSEVLDSAELADSLADPSVLKVLDYDDDGKLLSYALVATSPETAGHFSMDFIERTAGSSWYLQSAGLLESIRDTESFARLMTTAVAVAQGQQANLIYGARSTSGVAEAIERVVPGIDQPKTIDSQHYLRFQPTNSAEDQA